MFLTPQVRAAFARSSSGFLAQRKRPASFEAEIKIAYITRIRLDMLRISNGKDKKYIRLLFPFLRSYLEFSFYIDNPTTLWDQISKTLYGICLFQSLLCSPPVARSLCATSPLLPLLNNIGFQRGSGYLIFSKSNNYSTNKFLFSWKYKQHDGTYNRH